MQPVIRADDYTKDAVLRKARRKLLLALGS